MSAKPSGSMLRIRLDLTAFDLAWKRVWMLVDCDRTQNVGQLIQDIKGKYFESDPPNLKLCLDDPYEIPEFEDIQVIRDGDLLAVSEQFNLMPPKKKRKKHHSPENDTHLEISLFSTTKKPKSASTTDCDNNPELIRTSRKKKANLIPAKEPNPEQTGADALEEVPEPVVKATRKRKRRPKNRNNINTQQDADDTAKPLKEALGNAPDHIPVSVIPPIQPVKTPSDIPPTTAFESFEPSSKKISCDQVILG